MDASSLEAIRQLKGQLTHRFIAVDPFWVTAARYVLALMWLSHHWPFTHDMKTTKFLVTLNEIHLSIAVVNEYYIKYESI